MLVAFDRNLAESHSGKEQVPRRFYDTEVPCEL